MSDEMVPKAEGNTVHKGNPLAKVYVALILSLTVIGLAIQAIV